MFNICLESTIKARKGSYATFQWGTWQERDRLPTESSTGGQGGSYRVPGQFSVIQHCFLDILLGTAICSRQRLIFLFVQTKLLSTHRAFKTVSKYQSMYSHCLFPLSEFWIYIYCMYLNILHFNFFLHLV